MAVNPLPTQSHTLKSQRDTAVFGITRWYSRFQLPNAKMSSIVVQSIDDNPTTDPSNTQDTNSATVLSQSTSVPGLPSRPVASVTPDALPPIASNLEPEAATVDKPEALGDGQSTTSVPVVLNKPCPPFTLWVIQAGSVLLIDSIGANIDSLTQNMILRLAQGIVSEVSGKQVTLQVRHFQWPLFDHQYAPRDEDSAKRMFNEFLLESVSFDGINTLLLCGDTAVRYTHTEADDSLLLPNKTRLRAIVAPRLSSLLYSAVDKRLLWSQIGIAN